MVTISELRKVYSEKLSVLYNDGESKSIIRLVFEKVLQADALHLSLDRFRLLSTGQLEVLNKMLQRLLAHEPVQYVLGEADFCGLKFKVNKSVLIPRIETEELVRWAKEMQNTLEKNPGQSIRILDICTGSGCIAIALAKKFQGAIVEGCDISDDALAVAKENNDILQTKVFFFKIDILKEALPENKYDIIISNPPYITQTEKDTIEANVLEYEPHMALFSPTGDDLVFYREIGVKAIKSLKRGGELFFEINENKGQEIIKLLRQIGLKTVFLRKDINSKDRMVRAQKL